MTLTGQDVSVAAEFLRKNELVAIPTETVYGLAANGLNPDAVLKIYETKQRPSFNPLILHVADIERAKMLVESFPKKAMLLAEKFWPGPLTIVLKKKNTVPDIVSAGLDTVGIRIPRHPLALQLLVQLDFPLAAPSANPSGYVSPVTAQHVNEQLAGKVAYILDGGRCDVGIESTIVKVTDDEVTLLRLGGVEVKAIENVVGEIKIARRDGAKPESPGMLESHYSPRKKLLLGNIETNLLKFKNQKTGILAFRNSYGQHSGHLKEFVLSPAGDMHEAARNLFSYLRELDEADVEIILAENVPDEGLGMAINDRLRRAAA